jgi:ribonucleotide reductase alpha subunit
MATKVEYGGKVQTLSNVIRGFEWHENETYEMFGIDFEGHPDYERWGKIRRLLTSEDPRIWPQDRFPLLKSSKGYRDLPKVDWDKIRKGIAEHGKRHFYLLAYAPNTSTGVLCGVSGGYLPIYLPYYTETKSVTYKVVAKYLHTHRWDYQNRYQLGPKFTIDLTCALNRWIDTGLSNEINFDTRKDNIKEFSDLILNKFQVGELKAVYYNTSVKSDEDMYATFGTVCSSCEN